MCSITVPANQRSDTLDGFEVNVQHLFGESGFGLAANYTKVDSGLTFDDTDLGDQYPLAGLSDSANLVAFSALTSPRLGSRAIQPGDEVIGVAAGFPTTVNPILQFGAVPVFVDVDLATHNIDASKIEAAITPKTKAIDASLVRTVAIQAKLARAAAIGRRSLRPRPGGHPLGPRR